MKTVAGELLPMILIKIKIRKFILIYTTHKSLDEAKLLTDHLLNERLIACVNFMPINSEYIWQGKIENSSETVAILKTKIENWDKVKSYLEEHHPYDIPCIIKLAEVEANDSFSDWIQSETR